MADVVLVNPLAVIDGERVHFLRDWGGGEAPAAINYPPIDLAHAAAVLRLSGYSVELIDASALGMVHDALLQRLREHRPRIVGIPSAWGSLPDDLQLSARIKDALPQTAIVMSGPNVTHDPTAALDHPQVDFVIHGELEQAYLAIASGQTGPNLSWKKEGRIQTSERALNFDLDALPYPARDLLPLERYWNPYTRHNPFTSLWGSRGCPYGCNFCPINIWNQGKVRFRSVDNVVGEIEECSRRFAIRELVFKDQTFTLKHSWVKGICEGIRKRGLNVHWRCFATVDTVDGELLDSMREGGCTQICIGFESGNQEVLERSGKGTTLEQGYEAVRLARERGIEVAGTFVLGLIGDTEESIRQTLDYAVQLDPDYAQFQITTAVPGTEFYRYVAEKTGRVGQPVDYRWYRGSDVHNPDLDGLLLRRELRRGYRSFYFRPRFLWREMRKVRTMRDFVRKAQAGLSMLRAVNS